MRASFLLLSVSVLVSAANAQSDWADNQALCDYYPQYQLVFNDEFHNDIVDDSKWTTYFPFSEDGSDNFWSCRVGGEEIYYDELVSVSNGAARITLWEQPAFWLGYSMDWRSGVLFSRLEFNEGKFEIRCKLPNRPNTWPAFWLFGEGGNEIDVFEFCSEEYNDMLCSIHRTDPQNPEQHYTHHTPISSTSAGYHTYAIEWMDDWIIWYFDGTEVHRRCRWDDIGSDDCTLNGPYTRRIFPADDCHMNVVVSMGHGGMCSAPPSIETQFDFYIDYVRVWQNVGHFEQGLTNLCATPTRIVSSGDAFCSTDDEIDFHIEGPHGDPITWGFEQGNGGLSIVASDNHHCTVRLGSQWQPGDEVTLIASDPENPCHPGLIMSKKLNIGLPIIEPISGNGNTVILACPPDDQLQHFQHWCIEPIIWGARNINPSPVYSYTTHYPPDPVYNNYDPLNLDPRTSYDVGLSRPYRVFVDGEEQSMTFRATHLAEYSPTASIAGTDCQQPLLHCPDHYSWWGNVANEPFCLRRFNEDFCHDIRIVAQNGCGSVEEEFTVRDKCVLGSCDFADPDFPDLAQLVSVYPTPVSTDFIVTLDELISLAQVDRIEVVDAMMNEKAVVQDPTSADNVFSTSGWPSGIYYIKIKLKDGYQTMKIQIK